jgi:hypothetical protein
VIVLDPIGGGFDDFGSLPTKADPAAWRFYSAVTTDTNKDGTFEIDQAVNNCTPSCADGTLTHTTYEWTGTSYRQR